VSDAEDYQPSCYDCGRETERRNLQTREVIVSHDEGSATTRCRSCCARTVSASASATTARSVASVTTTRRAPATAASVGRARRRLSRVRPADVRRSASYDPASGTSVTWAECECCPVGWGAFTGWELLDGEPCKHVETDPRGTEN